MKKRKLAEGDFTFLQKFAFGRRLKAIAEAYAHENGYVKDSFAKMVGLSHTGFNRAQRGIVSDAQIYKICEILELDPAEETHVNTDIVRERFRFLWNKNENFRSASIALGVMMYLIVLYMVNPTFLNWLMVLCAFSWAAVYIFRNFEKKKFRKMDKLMDKFVMVVRLTLTPVLAVAVIIMQV